MRASFIVVSMPSPAVSAAPTYTWANYSVQVVRIAASYKF